MKRLTILMKFDEENRQILFEAYKKALSKGIIKDSVENFESFCRVLLLIKAEEYNLLIGD